MTDILARTNAAQDKAGPVKEVRAIQRAIAVIDALCRAGASTLSELSRATGLSKSTLRRILLTLENGHMVRCSLADRRYRANVHLPAYEQTIFNPRIARLTEAARPVLEDMARDVVWPSDLTIRDGLYLRVIETTRSISALSVNRNEIGDRVDIVSTAAGRAYLAFCPKAERDTLLAQIETQFGARAVRELVVALDVARAQGFAERGSLHTGNTERFPRRNDKLSAVAMPIMQRGRVAGSMNLLWPRGITETLGGAKAMAATLAQYIRRIEENLA